MVQYTFTSALLLLSSLTALTSAQTCSSSCAAATTVTIYQCPYTTPTPSILATSTPSIIAISSPNPATTTIAAATSNTPAFPTTAKLNTTTPQTSARISGISTARPIAPFTGAASALTPVIGIVGLGFGAFLVLL